MATILGSNITTVAQLDTAIAQANAETTAGAYEIDLGANASIALTQALTAISLHSGVTLDIEGDGATLNGDNAQQGLVVNAGTVTVENLTIENAKTVGAAGVSGGGGGAGLGGGLFIGATGNVALTNVSFSSDSATGGVGGAGHSGSAVTSGGTAGKGGSVGGYGGPANNIKGGTGGAGGAGGAGGSGSAGGLGAAGGAGGGLDGKAGVSRGQAGAFGGGGGGGAAGTGGSGVTSAGGATGVGGTGGTQGHNGTGGNGGTGHQGNSGSAATGGRGVTGGAGGAGGFGGGGGGGGGGGAGILPVCIKAGALGDNVPRRDLWISPHHAMYFAELGGVLVEAKDLVNGVSIVQAQDVDKVEYFHIELDTHDVIVAEGALSETFFNEHDSRGMFHNADEYQVLYTEEPTGSAQYCAPRCEGGYELEAVRHAIAQRAGDAAVASASTLRGHVDGISGGLVMGWAQNAGHPEAPVCLDVFADGRFVGQVLANGFREDLVQAGLGSGRHAFAFSLPADVTLRPETIEVRRSLDGALVGGCGDPVGEPQAA